MQWNLIVTRKKAGLKQEEIAEVMGISSDTYSMKERGKTQFKADEMFFLSEYFGKKIDEIFLPRNFGITEVNKNERSESNA